MVSNARLDLPLPLGPVTTVSFPSGRSRSIPLGCFGALHEFRRNHSALARQGLVFSRSSNPLEIFAASQEVRKFLRHKMRVIPNEVRDLASEVCATMASKRDQSPWERSLAPLGMTQVYSLNRAARFFCCCSNSFGTTPPNESKNSLCAAISFCHSS